MEKPKKPERPKSRILFEYQTTEDQEVNPLKEFLFVIIFGIVVTLIVVSVI